MSSSIDTTQAHLNGIEHVRPVADERPHLTREQRLLADDMEAIARIAFAETFASFERMRNAQGTDWCWVRTSNDGAQAASSEPITFDQIPHVAGTGFSLVEYLDETCRQCNDETIPQGAALMWGMQMSSPRDEGGFPVYSCVIVIAAEGKSVTPKANIEHTDPAMAIALCMLLLKQVNLPAMHRELFPEKYLLL